LFHDFIGFSPWSLGPITLGLRYREYVVEQSPYSIMRMRGEEERERGGAGEGGRERYEERGGGGERMGRTVERGGGRRGERGEERRKDTSFEDM
jgi:hypothetical protein